MQGHQSELGDNSMPLCPPPLEYQDFESGRVRTCDVQHWKLQFNLHILLTNGPSPDSTPKVTLIGEVRAGPQKETSSFF